jgi:HK97 family phage prohead protease
MSEQPSGELHVRAAQTVGVDFPKRIIELIVTPWESEALVTDRGPRPVTEIFSRGAYDGIEHRPTRIRANRDHQLTRTVGRAVSFNPGHERGLVAEVRIARTELGDETLALAEEDCLDASAGYRSLPSGEKWEARDRVRVNKAWLGHIALVPEAAYEGAKVLSVRHKGEPVWLPNRERLELEQLREQYAVLDARYGVGRR